MKRLWYFNTKFDRLKIHLAFSFEFPDKEDYYESQYQMYMVLFGLYINVGTWKEQ